MTQLPLRSQKILESFLTFLTDRSIDENACSNLPTLKENLKNANDDPVELAIMIDDWCKELNINFSEEFESDSSEEAPLPPTRANMADPDEDETIPQQAEGDRPQAVCNKALLVRRIDEAIEARSNE